MKNQTIKRIAEYAKQYQSDWDNVGVRIQSEVYGAEVGKEIEHESNEWDDGVMLNSTVGGVCAVDVDRAKRLGEYGGYDGDYAIILGSNSASCGTDPGELVMREAVVLEIIKGA